MNLFSKIKNYSLEISVFICGAVVMIFELVGSRITGPYVGTSIYSWTSIIGVILASLSFGYYIGGRLADKRPEIKPLAIIVFLSALAILLALFLKDFVSMIIIAFPFSIGLRAVLISLFLFAPAGILLGTVSPYAVRLRIKDSDKAGSAAGNLYAISTLGSIFGTFLAGFYLIPNFGSSATLLSLSIVLFFVSLFLFGKEIFSNWFKSIFIIPIIFILSFSFVISLSSVDVGKNLIIDIDTLYNRIQVYKSVDQKTGKTVLNLATDPFGTQAGIFIDGDTDLVFDYTKFYRLVGFFLPEVKNALMIGGAAYTYPRDFLKNFPDATMDVVEIDPGTTEIAKKYFGLKDLPNMSIIHEDGRTFLNENKKKYDAIFVDAFSSATTIPFQLTTVEAVKKIRDGLSDDGIVLVNVISAFEGDKGKFFRAEYATYKKIFSQIYVFGVQNEKDGKMVQNIMLVALKSDKNIVLKSKNQQFNEQLSNLWKNPIESDLPILTDDFAPVEYYKQLSLKKS